MFNDQLRILAKILKRVAYFTVSIFIFILIIEIIRMIQTLISIHPILAWSVGIIISLSILWGIWKIYRLMRSFPTSPKPPKLSKFEGKHSSAYKKEYIEYLIKIAKSLVNNNNINKSIISVLKTRLNDEKYSLIQNSPDALGDLIESIEADLIKPALSELDELAEIAVKNTVRDTMIGVMLLPFKAADIYLVVYRNGMMFFELIKIYNVRPTIGHTYEIFKDVVKMVATVNILSYTERFTQRLMANLPILDKTADDIIQGTGAGVMTTAVGKATIQRCRTFTYWNIEEQLPAYKKVTRDFFVYVKFILSDDVLPLLSTPWKQSWGYIKGLFIKSDPEEIDAGASSKSKWKFWKKTPSV